MSEKLAAAYIELSSRGLPQIKGHLNQAREELGRFVGSGNRAATSISGAFQRMSESAAGFAAGAALQGLASKFKEIISTVVQGTSAFEDYTTELTQLMKTAGATDPLSSAKNLIGQISDLAAKTPFEMPELVKGAKDLMKWGFAADGVIEKLSIIGDAAALNSDGMATTMDRVIRALGQMKGKTTAAGQEMLQLTEAGIPAWKYLAQAMGVSTAEAMKQVESRAISADKAISAVLAGIQKDFGGSMEAKSKTLSGMWSTLKDNLGAVARAMGGELLEPLKGAVDKISTLLTSGEFIAGARRVGAVLVAGTQMAVSAFQSLYSVVQPVVSSVVNAFGGWGPVLRGIAVGLTAVAIPAIAAFVASCAPVIAIVGGIAAAWSAFVDRFGPVMEYLAALAGSVFSAIAGYFASTIMPAVGSTVDFINARVDDMIMVFWGYHDAAVEVWAAVAETAQGVMGWLVEAWGGTWDSATGVMGSWLDTVVTVIKDAWSQYVFLLSNVGLVWKTMALQATEWGTHTMDIFKWLVTNMFIVWDNLPTVVSSVFGAAWQIISNFGSNIWELFKAIGEQIRSGFTADWSPQFRGLTDGVAKELSKLPQFAKMELTDFSKEWDKNAQQWNKAADKTAARREKLAAMKWNTPKALSDAIKGADAKGKLPKASGALPGGQGEEDGTTGKKEKAKKDKGATIGDIASAWANAQTASMEKDKKSEEKQMVKEQQKTNQLLGKNAAMAGQPAQGVAVFA